MRQLPTAAPRNRGSRVSSGTGQERKPEPHHSAAAALPFHYERRRLEETILYRLVQDNLETFLAQVEAEGGASLPPFVKDEFEAFLECGILAHGFLRVRGTGYGR